MGDGIRLGCFLGMMKAERRWGLETALFMRAGRPRP